MEYFSELLTTRKNPYAIDVELEIRKMFEYETDYTYEFQKNEDPYDYDISVFKYYISGADWEKKLIAFIELEVSENWITHYPYHWGNYSFLKRKVYKYDYKERTFTNELKNNADKTVYIIFNKSLTDAVCCDLVTISSFNGVHKEVCGNSRQDEYLREPLYSRKVTKGLKNCIEIIKNFIKTKE